VAARISRPWRDFNKRSSVLSPVAVARHQTANRQIVDNAKKQAQTILTSPRGRLNRQASLRCILPPDNGLRFCLFAQIRHFERSVQRDRTPTAKDARRWS
jgi:hypothetical protein